MRAPSSNTKLFWFCGGEILAVGGDQPLTMRNGGPSPGCRVVPMDEARRLVEGFSAMAAEAAEVGDQLAAAYLTRAGADVAAAVSQAMQLRAA